MPLPIVNLLEVSLKVLSRQLCDMSVEEQHNPAIRHVGRTVGQDDLGSIRTGKLRDRRPLDFVAALFDPGNQFMSIQIQIRSIGLQFTPARRRSSVYVTIVMYNKSESLQLILLQLSGGKGPGRVNFSEDASRQQESPKESRSDCSTRKEPEWPIRTSARPSLTGKQ